MSFVRAVEVTYFISESSYSFVVTKSGNRFILDATLDHIQGGLDPSLFFRINCKQTVSAGSIKKNSSYLKSRLKLDLDPIENTDTIVSRKRVSEFKEWLDR